MSHSTHLHRLGVAGAAVGVLALAACGTSGATSSGGGGSGAIKGGPGVDTTAKTITVGQLTPLSGPVAVIGKPLTSGIEAWFNHVNDNGGLSGYKINFKDNEKDNQYTPTIESQLYSQIQPNIAMLAQSLGSPTTQAIEQQAITDNILIGTAAQDSEFTTDAHNLQVGNPYNVDDANGVDYIVNKLGKKTAKVGVIYQNDSYGKPALKGIEAGLSAAGLTAVDEEPFNSTDKDFTAQVLKLKASGAEYVFCIATPTAAGGIVGKAATSGFFPQWVFQGPAWSEYLMTKDGTAAGAQTPLFPVLTGTVAPIAHPVWVLGFTASWGDTSVAGMAAFLADQQKYFPTQPPDGYYMFGYCLAKAETAILQKAIDSGDLSRAGILAAKQAVGTIDFGGLIPSATYSSTPGPASRSSVIAQVDAASPGFLKVIQPSFQSDVAKTLPMP
jgi:ABC-type branched-subunit amino acid transport system substrate-binding protein